MSSVVYFLRAQISGLIKIGWSAGLGRRLVSIRGLSPEPTELLATIPGGPSLEAHLHEQFADCRVRGEWFNPSAEMLAYVDMVVRQGAACIPLGFADHKADVAAQGLHSKFSTLSDARDYLHRALRLIEATGQPRMAAYSTVSRKVGASTAVLIRMMGRRDDLSVHAHVYLNLMHLAEELEKSALPAIEELKRAIA